MKIVHRREFLQKGSLGIAVLTAACQRAEEQPEPAAQGKPLSFPMGVQLYTVRNELEKDLEGTIVLPSTSFLVKLSPIFDTFQQLCAASLGKAYLFFFQGRKELGDFRSITEVTLGGHEAAHDLGSLLHIGHWSGLTFGNLELEFLHRFWPSSTEKLRPLSEFVRAKNSMRTRHSRS